MTCIATSLTTCEPLRNLAVSIADKDPARVLGVLLVYSALQNGGEYAELYIYRILGKFGEAFSFAIWRS